ncbi:MAG: hypothetical protein IPL94_07385 [Tetrasphaera sp.]|nr:hypothetical protein [Tetrasphaera sp.]
MTPWQAAPPWYVRVARIGAALLAALAVLVWVTPVNVPSDVGASGCGSPSAPVGGELADLVCRTDLDAARVLALTLLIAAAGTLLLTEYVAPRVLPFRWLPGVLVAAPLALGVVSVSVGSLVETLGGTNLAGAPYRCGSALYPDVEPISRLVCGQIADERRVRGLGGVLLGLGLVLAGGYLSPRRDSSEGEGGDASADVDGDEPRADPGRARRGGRAAEPRAGEPPSPETGDTQVGRVG